MEPASFFFCFFLMHYILLSSFLVKIHYLDYLGIIETDGSRDQTLQYKSAFVCAFILVYCLLLTIFTGYLRITKYLFCHDNMESLDEILERPHQPPNLNLTGKHWCDLKKAVPARKLSNITNLKAFIHDKRATN